MNDMDDDYDDTQTINIKLSLMLVVGKMQDRIISYNCFEIMRSYNYNSSEKTEAY